MEPSGREVKKKDSLQHFLTEGTARWNVLLFLCLFGVACLVLQDKNSVASLRQGLLLKNGALHRSRHAQGEAGFGGGEVNYLDDQRSELRFAC